MARLCRIAPCFSTGRLGLPAMAGSSQPKRADRAKSAPLRRFTRGMYSYCRRFAPPTKSLTVSRALRRLSRRATLAREAVVNARNQETTQRATRAPGLKRLPVGLRSSALALPLPAPNLSPAIARSTRQRVSSRIPCKLLKTQDERTNYPSLTDGVIGLPGEGFLLFDNLKLLTPTALLKSGAL